MTDNPIECQQCLDLGVQCPSGYITASITCHICSKRWVGSKAACGGWSFTCPKCGSQVDV